MKKMKNKILIIVVFIIMCVILVMASIMVKKDKSIEKKNSQNNMTYQDVESSDIVLKDTNKKIEVIELNTGVNTGIKEIIEEKPKDEVTNKKEVTNSVINIEEVRKNFMDNDYNLSEEEIRRIAEEKIIQFTEKIENGKDGIDGINGKDGHDGKDGRDGKNGEDGKTPVKGVDYFTEYDIEEISQKTVEKVTAEYMARIVEGVTLNLMKDGNITLSTYEKDVIETIVSRLMEENSSQIYIKEQVLETVQHMISSSLADIYDSAKTYDKGSIVTYNGNLYISNKDENTATPGESSDWNITTLTRLLTKFNKDVTSKLETVDYDYYPDENGSGKVVITLHRGGKN